MKLTLFEERGGSPYLTLRDGKAHPLEQRLDQVERRLDDRIVSVRDDLELMLKAELLGKLTHFETRIDERLAELESGG